MKFIARYVPITPPSPVPVVIPARGAAAYYRTIYEDSEHEANKEAKKYCRKGYMVAAVVSDQAGQLKG